MRRLHQLAMKLRTLLARRRSTQQLDAELRFHLDRETEENCAAGMTPEEARLAALRAFGNPALLRDQTQAAWGWNGLERLTQDFRFAVRQILRAPGFALVAILTLALGIGANTAIFSLTHALLLEGLPVPAPDQMVRLAVDLHNSRAEANNAPLNVPFIQFLDQHAQPFSGVFGWQVYDFVFTEGGVSRGYRGAVVSGNAFRVLGLRPAAGRFLTPADDQPGGGPDGWCTVISHRLWVSHFHADPSVIGRHITITDHSVTIVGVAPQGFEGMVVAEHPDFYLPVEFSAALNNDENQLHSAAGLWLLTFARLKPGVGRTQAQAEINTLFPVMLDRLMPPAVRHLPVVERSTLDVDDAHSGWTALRLEYTRPLLLLQILACVVLLICCANLSGLLLARASARRQEFAIRSALGAARLRLIRQLFVESLMLALPGALAGIGLSWLAGPLILHSLDSRHSEIFLSPKPDAPVLAASVLCAFVCALLFGVAPAWVAGHTSIDAVLKASNRRAAVGGSTARRLFIPAQVGLTLTLVVLAALLGSSIVRLRTDDSGYHAQNVVFYFADFGRLPQKGVALVDLYRRIIARMQEMPGVDAASVVSVLPFYGWISNESLTSASDPAHARTTVTDVNAIGADYFRAVGVPILAGRDLRNDDEDLHACIVNESAARLYFPHSAAVDKTLHQVSLDMRSGAITVNDCQIVGVVEDTKYDSLHETPPPILYKPYFDASGPVASLYFVIHARTVAAAETAYDGAIHELASASPETDPATLNELAGGSIAREQLLSVLSGFFAALGVFLSGIGIYGLVAWNVSQRTMEIGLRMALGASRAKVFLLILSQTTSLLALGLAVGSVAAYFAARSVSSFLYETHADSPGIFLASAAVLVAIAMVAALLPARRAVAIDPMQALRTE
jgi:predicted permease